MVVRVPARILAQRLLESGGLRDELRRFALAREGARRESHLGYALLNCLRISSNAMSNTGWRVHATRREQAWPREAMALMREFGALFAGLDQRLDEWSMLEGRPFPAGLKGEYDGGPRGQRHRLLTGAATAARHSVAVVPSPDALPASHWSHPRLKSA